MEEYFHYSPSLFFNSNKLTILMFRKKIGKKRHLELRHQRNTDVIFDFYDETRVNGISRPLKDQLYNIVETLLPSALKQSCKLVEFFAEDQVPRKGWFKICEPSED